MAAFVHQVALESPTEDQRRCMLQALTLDLDLGPDVDLERLSKLTAVQPQSLRMFNFEPKQVLVNILCPVFSGVCFGRPERSRG